MKSFVINNLIYLRFNEGKTQIYIGGEPFKHCKYLLLQIPDHDFYDTEKIRSIDDAEHHYSNKLENDDPEEFNISPETEFWAHCSNLQAWAEKDYNSHLLHRNLAFPLLKRLTELGDKKARKRFSEEILFRYMEGDNAVQSYLAAEGYLDILSDEERFSIVDSEKEIQVIKELETNFGKRFIMDSREHEFRGENAYAFRDGIITALSLKMEEECLPDIIKNFKNLEWLHITNNTIESLPEWIGSFSKLKTLFLSVWNLRQIPQSISNLKELKELHMHSKQLETLPDFIGELGNIESLRFDFSSNLKRLPESIGHLKKLKELYVWNCALSSLPNSFGNLESLEFMKAGKNHIGNLPENIGALKQLHTLELQENSIHLLPESFGKLKSLKHLNLDENELKILPKSFQYLKSLEYLRISGNQLQKLPEAFFNLKNLKYLSLGRNKLNNIPNDWSKLCRLEELSLSNNNLLITWEILKTLPTLKRIDITNLKLENKEKIISHLRERNIDYLVPDEYL
ncbi:MAG: leucine-rich repeat protein [Candidatus Lokiarchaeota archaeon]|nr:leucine-rich repeat protein [Candidatus Lokiarchaeota archaeon]